MQSIVDKGTEKMLMRVCQSQSYLSFRRLKGGRICIHTVNVFEILPPVGRLNDR